MARWTGRQESRKFIPKVKESGWPWVQPAMRNMMGPNSRSQGSGQAAKAALGTTSEEGELWVQVNGQLILMQGSSQVKSLPF